VLIARLKKNGIPYDTYVHPTTGVIMAIYWCDPKLITDTDALIHINMIVHDTTFGVVASASGYEKFTVIASVEPGGRSQVMLCGVAVSDRHEYFAVALGLWRRVYNISPPLLVVVSDEDRAFIRACNEVLTDFMTLICTWHKVKNVRKPRANDYDEFVKDESEEEEEEHGEEGV
jgi:hypothetical protein